LLAQYQYDIHHFLWLAVEACNFLLSQWIVTSILFLSVFIAAITQRVFTDIRCFSVFAFFASTIFVLVVGTLYSAVVYIHSPPWSHPYDGTWHQSIVRLRDSTVLNRDFQTWSVYHTLLFAAVIAHIAGLFYFLYALRNFRYFVVSIWAFAAWWLLAAMIIAVESIWQF